jgi:hypothetical protein
MRKNPAIWISLIGAVLALAVGFGLKISGVQIELIMQVMVIVVPLIMGGAGVAIRSQVYSPASAELALKMPQESSIHLLDKVLETGVKVNPTDTKADVVGKVEIAKSLS